jgi:hypothetical protein
MREATLRRWVEKRGLTLEVERAHPNGTMAIVVWKDDRGEPYLVGPHDDLASLAATAATTILRCPNPSTRFKDPQKHAEVQRTGVTGSVCDIRNAGGPVCEYCAEKGYKAAAAPEDEGDG